MNIVDSNSAKKDPTFTNFSTPSHSDQTPCIFARHETFHPRHGWLKKGFDLASADNEIFTKDDAPAILGVGKNMVKAIRYWCYAFKILDECQKTESRARTYRPTPFGKNLLGDGGWDPYLEDPASLWLLHWNLLKAPCYGTAWHYTFNMFHQSTFTSEDLLDALSEFVEQSNVSNKANPSSLIKDINCLLRMYMAPGNKGTLKEDSLDCPFNEMGLIDANDGGKYYSFNIGAKSNLPSQVIVAACLDYIAEIGHTAKTISVPRLCYDTGSPGQIYKLTEDSLYHAIEEVAEQEKGVSLSETAGSIQFVFLKEPQMLSRKILNRYYVKGT